ncbi:MAG: gamma-glutamyltransferase [Gammaproteobacteria bacterium]|nr:gamma-glutamyltransferase [Gammaproteobacteria bacterium]
MTFQRQPALFACATVCFALLTETNAIGNEVTSEYGVVTSRSEFASRAGTQALAQGGNAIDAIVAAGFALAVTYPSAGNLGGGGFMVIRMADGTVVTNDHREMAPNAAFRDMFLDDDGEYDPQKALRSHLASGVPGSVAGLLDVHSRFGELTREQVMAEAIRLASEGFKLPPDIARQISGRNSVWSRTSGSRKKFLKQDGSNYEEGDLFIQPDLAQTLRRIRDQGKDGFYKGKTAELIVAEMERGSGLISLEDLEDYRSIWREPIRGTYRGYEILSMPPPSSGGVLLVQMLNMLEKFNLGEMGSANPATMHVMVEAERRAYADRAMHLGDMDFYPVPIGTLTDKKYAFHRIHDLHKEKKTPSSEVAAGDLPLPQEHEETTHLSAVDAAGNAVAFTTTLNSGYGSGIVVEGAGFLLNNEMDDFSSKPGVPNQFGLLGAEANAIEPKKRMLSSMTPTIVVAKNRPILVTGSPGGSTIITTVLQIVVNVVDHGMSISESVTQPRFHHQWMPDVVTIESSGFKDETLDQLRRKGHEIRERRAIGDANTVGWVDDSVVGVSDPRNAGFASGLDSPPAD